MKHSNVCKREVHVNLPGTIIKSKSRKVLKAVSCTCVKCMN